MILDYKLKEIYLKYDNFTSKSRKACFIELVKTCMKSAIHPGVKAEELPGNLLQVEGSFYRFLDMCKPKWISRKDFRIAVWIMLSNRGTDKAKYLFEEKLNWKIPTSTELNF